MTKLILKFASISILSVLFCAAPAFQTQNLGSAVRVYTVPDGVGFGVDGQQYLHPMTAVWPAGSKHSLSVNNLVQYGQKTRYQFKSWQTGGKLLPGGAYVTITADSVNSEYVALFTAQYALNINFFECPDLRNCPSPGTIYVNAGPIIADQELYLDAGASVSLMAIPNPGYVFTGWGPGAWQDIQGFMNTVTLNGPMIVRPQFQLARKIQFASVPDGLELLADRTRITTPASLEWGWDSTHTVGLSTPQVDRFGKWWAFSSWSDGGAANHSYKVASVAAPETLTATFVAAAVTQVLTSPAGIPVKVDGRDNWASFDFIWGVGEKHRIEAPAQATTPDGRVWKFASWSSGAAAAHDYTVPASNVPQGARLIATYTPVGTLKVTSSMAGVSIQVDGVDCATPCEVQGAPGKTVKVSAPASIAVSDGVRADFAGWPGSGSPAASGSYTLTGEPMQVLLDYRLMNRLTTQSTPSEGGVWHLEPISADGYYDALATVMVNVSARPGFRFRRWGGDLSGTSPYGAVIMNAPRAVEALLERVPYVQASGVANAASGLADSGVAAGSIVSVFGASLAAAEAVGAGNPLPQTLGDVTVRIGERFLPLFFVSPSQINLQMPPDLGPGKYVMNISVLGMPDAQAAFTLARNAPGLFGQASDTGVLAVAAHSDGSAVTAESPARAGEVITVFGTGFGPTDTPRTAGFPLPLAPAYQVVDPAQAVVGEAAVDAQNAYAVAGRTGVDALEFRVPADVPRGASAPLRITINGVASNTVTLPIAP
jgi:uncharacterized protein (TIGR03437 family)